MQVFRSNVTGTPNDPLDTWSCASKDGRDLIADYVEDKQKRGLRYSTVFNTRELKNFNISDTDYLLGIFANGHLMLEHERNQGPEGMPSISDMTEAAIKVLSKNKKGYFLMVEGGNIDMSHHRGKAKRAVSETAAMDEAVRTAIELTDSEDTLIVVTSDHTHTLSINGYPARGSNIFGVAQPSSYDGINYTTLSYGTGGPGSFHFEVHTDEHNETHVLREDANRVETDSYEYEQVAGIRLIENSHGGGDVTIYARGPFSHLFHSVHEQHYVYHAISYAAKIGQFSGSVNLKASFLMCSIVTIVLLALR
ncbi:Alkaline phosphatase [Eumeta japonica]|uniref:alkaline phosphatase n=1 Tax=Eumeta variegata TaxID=151549 RepID=A0A4C1YH63_EUMVA|nr:Alkaline phosphatase [Eumeta japonica]